jgi:AraC-like DNA-binding protein
MRRRREICAKSRFRTVLAGRRDRRLCHAGQDEEEMMRQLPSDPSCVLVQMRATVVADGPSFRRMHRHANAHVGLSRIASVAQIVESRLNEVPPAARESTQFQLVRAGSVILEQGDRQTRYRAGELAVYDASRPFSFFYPEQFATTIVQVPTVLLDSRHAPSRSGALSMRVGSVGRRMFEDLLRGPAWQRGAGSAPSAVVEALRLMLAEQSDDSAERPRPAAELVRAALDDIHLRHTDPTMSLAAVAARLHVSLRTLQAAFEDREEKPGAVIRRLRLAAAGRLLLTTDETVAQIAAAVGYTDVTAFIRSWSAGTGETPARWRRRHRGGPAVDASPGSSAP